MARPVGLLLLALAGAAARHVRAEVAYARDALEAFRQVRDEARRVAQAARESA